MTDRGGFAALDPCVHCGFCLQACPTFLATGDEADSPRGRIELMRALEAGELAQDDPALALHLDRCLGCRGCEPVCPSGVGYGRGLAAARALIADRRGVPALARLALAAMTGADVSRVVYALARALRATGIPRWLAGWGRVRFAMGMLAATAPKGGGRRWRAVKRGARTADTSTALHRPSPPSTVLLFRGCVMEGLFSHVHDATVRTLEVNGYAVREVPEQVCCGALHEHAGLEHDARGLARLNVAAFGAGDEPIVVNSAGCGAMLKEYGHLLHAQRIAEPPERVLRAIPVLRLVKTPDAAQCCGSAGLFTLLEPAMSRAVLAPKLDTLAEARPQVVATGNPGCLMQLGAGLAAAGIRAVARHPVELLDESYRAAGYYA